VTVPDADEARQLMTMIDEVRLRQERIEYGLADELAEDPEVVISEADGSAGLAAAPKQEGTRRCSASAWLCSRIFPARHDQVAEARAFVGRMPHGCPMVEDAQLICSELFTNAVQYSRSAQPGGHVIVRAEVRAHDYLWLEVEDQGGAWGEGAHDDERGRGLMIVAALADYWDVRSDDARRMVCARMDWPEGDRATSG